MLKSITQQYDSVKFSQEFFPYLHELLNQTRTTKSEKKIIRIYEVLFQIAKNSPSPKISDGVTQEQIKIGIPQIKLEEVFEIDRHILKEILGILTGAMLIQYDDQFRVGKYWTCTPRAWQYLLYFNSINK